MRSRFLWSIVGIHFSALAVSLLSCGPFPEKKASAPVAGIKSATPRAATEIVGVYRGTVTDLNGDSRPLRIQINWRKSAGLRAKLKLLNEQAIPWKVESITFDAATGELIVDAASDQAYRLVARVNGDRLEGSMAPLPAGESGTMEAGEESSVVAVRVLSSDSRAE